MSATHLRTAGALLASCGHLSQCLAENSGSQGA